MAPTGSPDFPVLLLLLGIAVVCIPVARKITLRTLGLIVCIGGLMLVVGYAGFQRGLRQQQSEVPVPRENATDQLWQRFSRARIPLDSGEAPVVLSQAQTNLPPATAGKEGKDSARPAASERPAWVDQRPKSIGNVYREVVSSGPFSSVEECRRQLEEKVRESVRKRMTTLSNGPSVQDTELAGVGLEYIFREIYRDDFQETTWHDFGEMRAMTRLHVLMEFTAHIDEHLIEVHKEQLRQVHMRALVGLGLIVMVLMAGAFGLLKFDTWTRGAYTKQLCFGVPAVIIGIILLLAG